MRTPRRKLRWTFATLGLLACAIAAALGIREWHRLQKNAIADSLLVEARNAWSSRSARQTVDLLDQFYALRPADRSARSHYAQALDEILTTPKARPRVFLAYEDALRDHPDDLPLRKRLIEIALELQRVPDAVHHLDVLRAAGSDDAWHWLQVARCQQQLAQFQTAANAASDALQRDPSLIPAAELLCALLRDRLERAEDVEPLLDRVVRDNPRSAAARQLRADHFLRSDRPDRAEPDLQAALETSPQDQALLLLAARWGIAMLRQEAAETTSPNRQQRIVATRERIHRGIELFPQSIEFHLLNADLEESLGAPQAAEAILRQALNRMPDDVRLSARLADLCIRQNQLDDAERITNAIPDGNVTRPLKLFLDGRRAMQSARWGEARRTLERALREASETQTLADHISLALADCYRNDGHEDLEAAAYRRVLRNTPSSDAARLGLAEIALRQQRPADAIVEFRLLKHRADLRPRLAALLAERNARLPAEARDWSEFNALVETLPPNLRSDSAVQQLLAQANSLGWTASPQAASQSTATKPASYPSTREPSETTDASQFLRASIKSGDLFQARERWTETIAPTSGEPFAPVTAELCLALLAQNELAAAEPLRQWLTTHHPHSLVTLQASVSAERANKGEAAAFALFQQAGRSPFARQPGRRLELAVIAIRAAGRSQASSTPAADWNAAALDGLKQELQQFPERLVLFAAFLAVEQQRAVTSPLLADSAWEDFRHLVAEDPTLVIRWSGALDAFGIQRLETAAVQAMPTQRDPAALPVSLADFEALLNRPEVAERWYRHVLQSDPTHPRALNNLAWMLALQRKSLDEAQTLIDRAIKVSGPEPRLLDTRGCVALARGNARAALRDFEASLAEQPGHIAALHLAQARHALGDRDGAAHAVRLLQEQGIEPHHLHPLERPAHQALQKQHSPSQPNP